MLQATGGEFMADGCQRKGSLEATMLSTSLQGTLSPELLGREDSPG